MDSAPGGALDLQFEEEASLRGENLQVLVLDEFASPHKANCSVNSFLFQRKRICFLNTSVCS